MSLRTIVSSSLNIYAYTYAFYTLLQRCTFVKPTSSCKFKPFTENCRIIQSIFRMVMHSILFFTMIFHLEKLFVVSNK